jgi:integrase
MSETHSTTASRPAKPYPEFPLTPHPAGYWCKKIRGKLHYFGPWADPDGALQRYLEQRDALHAGKKPREETDGVTIKEVCNRFLNAKQQLVDAGELSPRTWDGYKEACEFLVKDLGKARLVSDLDPDDFATLRNRLAKKLGPHGLGTRIQCIRCTFKFAYDAGLIPTPIRYGPGFKRPSKKTLRIHRARQGVKLFTAEEIRRLLGDAGTPMKAIILLGINCGFGNSDVGNLPLAALDLECGVIDYPRPKTGIPRRCILWPETVAAMREALEHRPQPKHEKHMGLVFLTQRGLSWAKETKDSPITKELRKRLDSLRMNGHRNYYTLRHTFRTVADEARDQPAADYIMGHEVPHMSSVYRETISDARLRAVADHVRNWLFGGQEPKASEAP